MIPVVALQTIPVICGEMLARTLSGGFAPPAAWQNRSVFHGAQRGSKTVLFHVLQAVLFESYDQLPISLFYNY